MKTIASKLVNGANAPASEIPSTAISVVFNGTNYIVYEKGDAVPAIDYKDAPVAIEDEATLKAQLTQSQLDAGLWAKLQVHFEDAVTKESPKAAAAEAQPATLK